jgi:hypothetical protein
MVGGGDLPGARSGLGLAAALIVLALPDLGAAQPAPSTAPPGWPELLRCAAMTDAEEELACYRQAMRAAGFSPSPAAVAADRRRRFGAPFPRLGGWGGAPTAERPGAAGREAAEDDEVSVTLVRVSFTPPGNRFLVVTEDGAVWEQIDNEPLPQLRRGQTVVIRRTGMGGYFCRLDKHHSARCARAR